MMNTKHSASQQCRLGLRGAASNTSALIAAMMLTVGWGSTLAVDFCVNPGFETGTGNAAPPWSYWGGTGGAIANPFVNADNASSRVWSNFGNPTYVNAASQNYLTNVWLVPGFSYHVHAQYYVPSSEIVSNATPRAGIRLSQMSGAQWILDPNFPDNAANPVSASIATLNKWVTFDFDWVYPGTLGDPPVQLNYMSFRLYGGNATYGLSTTNAPNPGGYFDNCQFSSASYRNDIHGLVKDNHGNPVAGAQVVLSSSYAASLGTATTLANGSYSFSNSAPYTYTVTVDATKPLYASAGPQSLTLSAASGTMPDIILNTVATYQISGTVSGLPAGRTALIAASDPYTLITFTNNSATDGTYSLTVEDNGSYTVTASAFPATAPAQPVNVSHANVPGINFALTDNTLVWYKFDGNTADSSAQANNGSLAGAAAIVPHGRVGNSCLSTAGGNGGVQIGNALASSLNGYTLSAWVRCTSSAQSQTLYATPTYATSGDVRNQVFSGSSQMLASVFQDTTGNDQVYAAPWGIGQWHFMTLVYDSMGSMETFYFDGAPVRTAALTIAYPVILNAGSTIGYFTTAGNQQFTGEIDDFRITGIPASASDAAALYASYPAMVTHTITASSDAGATLSPSGAVSVMNGYDQTFTISQNLGYSITSVLVDGLAKTPLPSSYTFTNVTANHTLSVASILNPTHTISGTVMASGVGVAGAIVYFSGTSNASVSPFTNVTTGPSGNFSVTLHGATYYVCAGASGYWNTPDATVNLAADTAGLNFSLVPSVRHIPNTNALLFSVVTESLPNSGAIASWASYVPAGQNYAAIGAPTVAGANGNKWENNVYADGDGFRVGTYTAPIPCSGVSIVAVVKPKYIGASGEARGEIVDFFYSDLFLAVSHNPASEGQVIVDYRGYHALNTGYVIPDGQGTILSLIVQPNGDMALFANGVSKWTASTATDYTSLQQSGLGGAAQAVTIGRNAWDGWSIFSGYIGDVFVYTNALSSIDRASLEYDLGTKFNIALPAPPVVRIIGMSRPDVSGNFTIFGTTDKAATITLFKSPNAAAPLSSWTQEGTAHAVTSGAFGIPATGVGTQYFYRLKVQ